METSVTVTADSTGKFRLESKGVMGMTLVFDGSTMWMYMPAANSYSKIPLHSGAEAGGGMFGLGANGLQEYKNVTARAKESKILRSEKLRVNDSDADCWVFSLEYEPMGSEASVAAQAAGVPVGDFAQSKTLWVDKTRYLVYQVDAASKMTMPNANTPTNVKQTRKVESITVNEPVSPDVFTFTPPAGAKEMGESKFNVKTSQQTQQNLN